MLSIIQDGPSTALLRFMEAYSFEAPDMWDGVHHLDVAGGQPRLGAAFNRTNSIGNLRTSSSGVVPQALLQ